MRFSTLAPALTVLTVALAASADTYSVVGKPDLAFTAIGPGGLKINGSTDTLQAFEDGGKLIFKARLSNIKTGIGLRDKHTKRYLGTDQWPDASLTLDKKAVKIPADGKKAQGSAVGKFRLHGVTRDTKVSYVLERHGSQFTVSGRFNVNIENHKIEQPCYLGVCVDPNVKVNAKFKINEK